MYSSFLLSRQLFSSRYLMYSKTPYFWGRERSERYMPAPPFIQHSTPSVRPYAFCLFPFCPSALIKLYSPFLLLFFLMSAVMKPDRACCLHKKRYPIVLIYLFLIIKKHRAVKPGALDYIQTILFIAIILFFKFKFVSHFVISDFFTCQILSIGVLQNIHSHSIRS